MSNFDTCVVHSGIGAILGDPKSGAIHVGSQHYIALTAYTWITLVINCNNEVCSHTNNTVSKAFLQKKVLPKQRISSCGVIYMLVSVLDARTQLGLNGWITGWTWSKEQISRSSCRYFTIKWYHDFTNQMTRYPTMDSSITP